MTNVFVMLLNTTCIHTTDNAEIRELYACVYCCLQYKQYKIVAIVLERGYVHPHNKRLCHLVKDNLTTKNKKGRDSCIVYMYVLLL